MPLSSKKQFDLSPMSELKNERQQQRLKYIDLCAYILGYVNRKLLMNRFDIKEAWATKDFAQYQLISSDSLIYDHTLRAYKPVDWFVPVYEHSTNDALQLLSRGTQTIVCEERFSQDSHSYTLSSIQPVLKNIYPVLRALYLKKNVDIKYISRSSGISERTVAPHTLIQTGCFFYIRAFDYKSGEFRSFKLNRIIEATLTRNSTDSTNLPVNDIEWLEVVTLTIIVNAGLSPEAIQSIEYDYDLVGGELTIQLKRALVPYFLNDWNIAPLGYTNLPAELFPLQLQSITKISEKSSRSIFD